mmetsp:Transcript_13326/g.19960  ORF Transcript_13326/g.19960 Transcript_13326/m.19960 type:complete len:153 (+) Transcript_13326:1-459(+)
MQSTYLSLLLIIITMATTLVVESFMPQPLFSKTHPSTSNRGTTLMHAAPDGMKWFVKTEQFCKPYPQVKPYLEAHREWVRSLREDNTEQQIVVSGYRVDENNKPGGGGLMIFAAKDHDAAVAFVNEDPLIQHECVEYKLNRWIPETGDISLE